MKPRICFDMDGVLTCFEKNVYLVSESLWPGKMPKDYVPKDWDYTDIFTKKEWNKIWETIRTIPNFWIRQPEMPESVKALKEFRMVNDTDIWFLTSRLPTGGVSAKYQTELWLLSRSLITLKDVHKVIAVSKPEDKRQWMEQLNIEFSIDDFGPTVERHNSIPGHKALCLDQPWNRQYTTLPRVFSVKQFLEAII